MPEPVTTPRDAPVAAFLAAVEPARRRDEAQALDALFRDVTGYAPVLWGPSMVGYGRYAYRYDSGRSGTSLATGFSPRKANLVIYLPAGLAGRDEALARLGPHKTGAGCLYLTALAKVDMQVLAELIRDGLEDLRGLWPVEPG